LHDCDQYSCIAWVFSTTVPYSCCGDCCCSDQAADDRGHRDLPAVRLGPLRPKEFLTTDVVKISLDLPIAKEGLSLMELFTALTQNPPLGSCAIYLEIQDARNYHRHNSRFMLAP